MKQKVDASVEFQQNFKVYILTYLFTY